MVETVSVVMQGGVTMKSFPTGAPPSTCEADEKALEIAGLCHRACGSPIYKVTSFVSGGVHRGWSRSTLEGPKALHRVHFTVLLNKGRVTTSKLMNLATHGKLTWHVGWFYNNLTQLESFWEKGFSIGNMPPQDWPVGKSSRHSLD